MQQRRRDRLRICVGEGEAMRSCGINLPSISAKYSPLSTRPKIRKKKPGASFPRRQVDQLPTARFELRRPLVAFSIIQTVGTSAEGSACRRRPAVAGHDLKHRFGRRPTRSSPPSTGRRSRSRQRPLPCFARLCGSRHSAASARRSRNARPPRVMFGLPPR